MMQSSHQSLGPRPENGLDELARIYGHPPAAMAYYQTHCPELVKLFSLWVAAGITERPSKLKADAMANADGPDKAALDDINVDSEIQSLLNSITKLPSTPSPPAPESLVDMPPSADVRRKLPAAIPLSSSLSSASAPATTRRDKDVEGVKAQVEAGVVKGMAPLLHQLALLGTRPAPLEEERRWSKAMADMKVRIHELERERAALRAAVAKSNEGTRRQQEEWVEAVGRLKLREATMLTVM
jgi:hypothetical protein